LLNRVVESMSEDAYRIYEDALKAQHSRNEARRIRTRVTEARRNPHAAALRWPFELLQNALDAGPRNMQESVTVRLRRDAGKVAFEHDGAAFTSEELAALLSGGSSKEFESEVTTGRFGTGFLVTHVLAERTDLRGLLSVPGGVEQFHLALDRGGDEDAILENIRLCNEAIRGAAPISDLDGVPSAQFEYAITDGGILDLSLQALRRALPYLYATRPKLRSVVLELEKSGTEAWRAEDATHQQIEGGFLDSRSIIVSSNGKDQSRLIIHRFTTDSDVGAAALVLVEQTEDRCAVRLPEPDAPRVYREYPLRSSTFVPISFVLDGKFEPDQERSRPLMSDADKQLFTAALRAAVVGARFAVEQRWSGAHMLARACDPPRGFDTTDDAERQWWTEQLADFAGQLAVLPIVQCESKYLPAIAVEGATADFVIPRLLPVDAEDSTTVERLWPLVDAVTDLLPPISEIARDWTDLAEGWHSLGLEINWITVSGLPKYARDEARSLQGLRIEKGRPLEWLAGYLDVVGECWSRRSGIDLSVLSGMLPNQNAELCSPEELKRDDGIPEQLKHICAEIGFDVRGQLLLEALVEVAQSSALVYVADALEKAIQGSVSEFAVIDDAIARLGNGLREDEDCDEQSVRLQRASVKLIQYLWESRGKDGAAIVQKMPFVTSRMRSVRWSHDRMMMAPVSTWHVCARPFLVAYPPHRILAELYAGCEVENIPNVVASLVAWGIALPDPLTNDTPAELKDRRLSSICIGESDGVVVSHETFSQIALLQPEVLNRCREGIDEARALLGLLLNHIAPHDPQWRQQRTVKGRKSGEDVRLSVRGALWLADLKFRAWVPVPAEEGKPQTMVANKATLAHLLDPAWLVENDPAISLLSEWFDFDQLELRLLGLARDDAERKKLRNGLAKLVESGGADPNFYAQLAEEVESRRRRSRDVARCRRLGMAVQEAIKTTMENYGLKLTLVDRGFDYDVTAATGDALEDAATWLEIGSFLLEVKATVKGDAHLTPTQAQMAANKSNRYILCVVDLRGLSEDDLDSDWTAERVEALAKIVTDIGEKVKETCLLVEAARARSVAIRNEGALRYQVPVAVWRSGSSIADWVATLADPVPTLKKPKRRGRQR
jgi:hypothetical protein